MKTALQIILLLLFFTQVVMAGALSVAEVEASGFYPSAKDGVQYLPANVLDKDPNKEWVSRQTDVTSRGEWLKFHFDAPKTLTGMQLINGRVKHDALWLSFSRIKTMKLTFSDGFSQTVSLEDSKNYAHIKIDYRQTEWVLLTIEEVYPGKHYLEAALTFVSFFGEDVQAE